MNTISPVTKPIHWVVKWFTDTKLAKNAGVQEFNNNRKYIDALGVASIIAKDGLGCYLYVTQSLNNKDIPDDKRSFVASLDLTNGLLMILLQILMFKTVQHKAVQTKMFDKFFGKVFDRPMEKICRWLTKHSPDYNDITDIIGSQRWGSFRSNVRDAFGGVTSLIAASIIGKRVLVPFIATPLAGVVEKQMIKRKAEKKGLTPEQIQNNDKSKPAMQGKLYVVSTADQIPADNSANSNLLAKYR